MIKKHEASYQGMSKDLASDLQTDKYFDAQNIRILATDQKSSFAVTNEAGNELVFVIPTPVFDFVNTRIAYTVGSTTKYLTYATTSNVVPRCELEETYVDTSGSPVALTSGTQIIIGTKELRDSALIVTTDDNGWDCFWELTNLNDGTFDLDLLYMNNLGLSKNNLVQVLFNYENSVIQKIYFVDGKHQLRFLNLRQSIANGDRENLIDLSASSIDTVSTFTLSQPTIDGVVAGGSHTAGQVQYAYGLYILNGAQTTISPLSELVAIDKGDGLGGGEVNEILGRSVQVSIPDIDTKFTNIKLYSIKYTSLNQAPEINIVVDKQIDDYSSMLITDDGSSQEAISLEAFVFLGSDPIVPQHIATKDNRLFPINITQSRFEVDLDTRAYSFSSGASCQVLNNPYVDAYLNVLGSTTTVTGPDFILPPGHDAVNKDYDVYKYQDDGSTLGATGKYVEVEVVQSALTDAQAKDLQFLKDNELYRLGIKFYNRRGQTSDPSWVMDLKTPAGNLEGNYNQLRVTLTAEFYTWLNTSSNFATEDDKPIGYKILRADRTLVDQTIFAQGFINPMIANFVHGSKFTSLASRKNAVNSNESDIIPSMTRLFETVEPFVACKDYHETAWNSTGDSSFNDLGRGRSYETFKAPSSKDWRAQNFQHNRLMQFFSPEVLFRDNPIDSSYKLRIRGLMEQDYMANWSTETNPVTAVSNQEIKFLNGITSSTSGVTFQTISGSPGNLSDQGFYGPTNSDHDHATHQVYRSFQGNFNPASGQTEWEVYGSPELVQEGADFTAYNNDFKLRYANNLKTMRVDNWVKSDAVHKDSEQRIKGCNTIGAKCIVFAEGDDSSTAPIDSRKSIEQIHAAASTGATNGVLIAEFVKEDYLLYTGGMYGGMSFESKANASYIEIGEFAKIATTSIFIESPGDTFVNTFTFTKMVKDDVEIQDQDINVVSEIVSIKVETTVDLKNRNDLSIGNWDNRWQPRYDEYQQYNTVYSQQPTLIKSVGLGSKIKKIQEFDGRLMASKVKIPGEFIDSWTDFLENETMDLDGKFGPINAVVNLNDEIFCLQDTAVAHIAINPRVQVPGDDGVALELGTGGILHDYTYKSTTTGCLNKWGVITGDKAFYFIDLINRGIMVFDGAKVGKLSDANGFHHELLNRINFDDLRNDNAVLGTGVSLGYNPVNNDVYFSFLQSTDSFTLGFNEKVSAFVSFYDYVPAWYINKGSVLISTNPTHTSLWEHFKGNANQFYGTAFRSSITLHIAPEGNEIILNGASFKLELTKDGVELPNQGLTKVRVYNDYQDSGEVTLQMRKNMWKKFRNWKINFPRQSSTRERVRSAWGFAEFIFENEDGKKLILHDITIFYTQP
jgi:hypothetical protein